MLFQTTAEDLEAFASAAGDVKYLKLGAVDETTGLLNALVEYDDQCSIPAALQLHSLLLNGNQIK